MTAVAEAPEVAAARDQLDTMPEAWRTDDLTATVLSQATARAVVRLLGQRAVSAQARAAQAAQDALAGDLDALDELLAAEGERAAAVRATALISTPALDPQAVAGALRRAEQDLFQADLVLTLPALDLSLEMARWAEACRSRNAVLPPPQSTDLDREVEPRASATAELLGRAHEGFRAWRTDAQAGAGDPMGLLVAGAVHLRRTEALTEDTGELAALIEKANEQRRAAGLTWTYPVGPQ